MRKHYIFVVIIAFLITSSSFNNVIAQSIQTSTYSNSDSISTEYYKNVAVTVNVEKELFPVIAKLLSEGNVNYNLPHLVNWTISNNNSDSIKVSISCIIPEWTSPIINTVIFAPNENKNILQTPFGLSLLSNETIVPATILLKVKIDEIVIFEETRNINVRPVDDMIWSLHSSYDTELLIAAWVTPNDEMVESILSKAKERLYGRSLSGYRSQDLIKEIREIFNAVRNSKVSYIDSHMSFGNVGFTQRVRLPRESIMQKSANCIDGSVLFASLFENIGLETFIVLMPGHAIVGVRLAPNSPESIFIETTIVGRSMLESVFNLQKTFDAAVDQGLAVYNNALQSTPSDVRIIDIKYARTLGIYPLK